MAITVNGHTCGESLVKNRLESRVRNRESIVNNLGIYGKRWVKHMAKHDRTYDKRW